MAVAPLRYQPVFLVGREGICTLTNLMAVLQTVGLTRAQPTHISIYLGASGEIRTHTV